jgi:hypothetical protein
VAPPPPPCVHCHKFWARPILNEPQPKRAPAQHLALGRRHREHPVAPPHSNPEVICSASICAMQQKYCCYAASASDSFGIPVHITRRDCWKSQRAPETILPCPRDHLQ